jgi:hypothetical protein
MGADGVLYGVPVSTHPQFRAGAPAPLFRIPVAAKAALATAFGFDVSADGGKFLLPVVQEPATSHLVVMLGWESFLKRKGPDACTALRPTAVSLPIITATQALLRRTGATWGYY